MQARPEIRLTIIHYLDWLEGRYNQYIFDCGLIWLDVHFDGFPKTHAIWETSGTFWNWWKHQWDLRDSELCLQLGVEPTDRISPEHREAFESIFFKKHQRVAGQFPAKPIAQKIINDNTYGISK